jgi:hypothetical protein
MNQFGVDVTLFCARWGITKKQLAAEANIPYDTLLQVSKGRRSDRTARKALQPVMDRYNAEAKNSAAGKAGLPYEQLRQHQNRGMADGEDRRRVWERVTSGEYIAQKQAGVRGADGERYLVAVSSLPRQAQIIYLMNNGVVNGPVTDECDLAGYHARFGDDGISELLHKQRAVLQGLAIRKLDPEDVVTQLSDLAADHGTSLRTLYRWLDASDENGLPGIMRAMARKDQGSGPSICAAAYQYAYGLSADKVKRTQATIYNKLCDRAKAMGPKACAASLWSSTPTRSMCFLVRPAAARARCCAL